jgi:hypothetical protein
MNASRSLTVYAPLALLSLLIFGAGCSANASQDQAPPQSSGGSSCNTDETVACADGTGYSCIGGDTPDESDATLDCSEGTAGNAGSTLYCCFTRSTDTTCADDPTVSCPGGGFGFSCANASEEPNHAYPSLNCSPPTAGNAGSEIYCCTD